MDKRSSLLLKQDHEDNTNTNDDNGTRQKIPADDATPCTVFPATFATEPIVFPATFATAPIEPVTVPTNCAGIEIILFKSPPVVLIICDGNPRIESKNILR